MASIRITRDTLTPGTRRLARALSPGNRNRLLEAMALEMRSMTVEAFQLTVDRPAPWAPKRDGSPSNLVKTTALRRSFQVRVSGGRGYVQTDRPYAAAHQFGSRKRSLPARPFFPFLNGRLTTPARLRLRAIAQDRLRQLLR